MEGSSMSVWPPEVFSFDPEREDHYCPLCKKYNQGGEHLSSSTHIKRSQNIDWHLSMADLRQIRDDERAKIEAFNLKKQEFQASVVAWRHERFGDATEAPATRSSEQPPPPPAVPSTRWSEPPPPPLPASTAGSSLKPELPSGLVLRLRGHAERMEGASEPPAALPSSDAEEGWCTITDGLSALSVRASGPHGAIQ